MEKLTRASERLGKGFGRFSTAVNKCVNPPVLADEEDIESYTTALAVRFESTHDFLCATLQSYLSTVYSVDKLSPKDVFEKCLEYKLIDAEHVAQLLEMFDLRNILNSEYYEDAVVRSESKKIINEFYPVLKTEVERVSKLIDEATTAQA